MQEKIKTFKDLTVWKKSADLAVTVYELTNSFPKEESYGLTSQLRRAAVSISSNIAEGFKRSFRKEKVQFYTIALSSLAEVESQIEIAKRLGYLNPADCDKLESKASEVNKMLSTLMRSAQDRR